MGPGEPARRRVLSPRGQDTAWGAGRVAARAWLPDPSHRLVGKTEALVPEAAFETETDFLLRLGKGTERGLATGPRPRPHRGTG